MQISELDVGLALYGRYKPSTPDLIRARILLDLEELASAGPERKIFVAASGLQPCHAMHDFVYAYSQIPRSLVPASHLWSVMPPFAEPFPEQVLRVELPAAMNADNPEEQG
jgi:hypothetical protein